VKNKKGSNNTILVAYPMGATPVVSFRRIDSSGGIYDLVVPWTSVLASWNDIAIPDESSGARVIIPNDDDPDGIQITLPPTPGIARRSV
jgi:hypothetical protein